MNPFPSIAFLGTGLMGAPMCQNLLSAGLPLTVWNRSLAKAEPLAKRGAVVADSPQSAVTDADVVITMLSDGPAVSAGGDAETFAAMQPVFAALGQATHVGPNGCGQLAKLANQIIVAITIGAVSEALILAGGGGADLAKVREALQGGFASSRILTEHGQRMVDRAFEPGGPAKFQLKDLHNALSAADRLDLDLPITKLLHGLFDAMVQSGKGDMDHSGLLTHLEALNNITDN